MTSEELQQLQLIRPTEAARLIGVHVKTLARWRVRGEGPHWYDMPNGARYDRSEVTSWLHGMRKGE